MLPSRRNGSWEVHCSTAILGRIRRLQREAASQGRGRKALAAIRRIRQRLSHDPFGFGEPLYHLPALKLQVRTAIVLPLLVDFAVSEERPMVFIKNVELLAPSAA